MATVSLIEQPGGCKTVSFSRLFLPVALTQITGVAYGPDMAPLVGATIQAIVQTNGDAIVAAYAANLSTIIPTKTQTTTNSTGAWSLELFAPTALVDLFNSSLTPSYTLVLDALGTNPIFAQTGSFSSSTTPLSVDAVLPNPKPFIATQPIIGFVSDSLGNPLANISVTATLNYPATIFNGIENVTICSDQSIAAISDAQGYYNLNLIASNSLVSTNPTYYTIVEGPSKLKKYIRVPIGGGYVQDNLVSTDLTGVTTINPTSFSADTQESTTYTYPVLGDDIRVNLAGIRSILSALYNTPWATLLEGAAPPFLTGTASPIASAYLATTALGQKHGHITTTRAVTTHFGGAIVGTPPTGTVEILSGAGVGATPTNGVGSITGNNYPLPPVGSSTFHCYGNTIHGVVAWRSGTSGWATGPQVRVIFIPAPYVSSQLAVQIMAANSGFALGRATRDIYYTINEFGLTINFGTADTAQTTYAFYYAISGVE